MTSPTALSLRLLRRRRMLADVCERWVPHANIRRDLFGAFDIVAIDPDQAGVLAVQTTSRSCLSARVAKLRALPAVTTFLAAGNRVHLHGWCKVRGRWRATIIELLAGDMRPMVVEKPPRKRRRVGWEPSELFF